MNTNQFLNYDEWGLSSHWYNSKSLEVKMGQALRKNLEVQFKDWKDQWVSGQISQEQFLTEIGNLQVQDEEGVWWTIDPITERIMYYDGVKWNSVPITMEQNLQQLPWRSLALVFALLLLLVLCIVILLGLYEFIVSPI
jgi:hypothetical protein